MTLAVRALSKAFAADGGATAAGIFDVSFELEPGAFFTLLGPSGCGKTTTLRAIAGLQQPDAGFIGVAGRAFYDSARGVSVPMDRRGIGMVFQSYAIWPHMSVAENVAFPLRVGRPGRIAAPEVAKRVDRALAAVDMAGFGDRPATRLSGGQQQRVALARAIVAEPPLLLLDEPLSNLDAALREAMRTELKRLQRQLGITTVYVTHDQGEALEMSDQIAVMAGGRIVQMGAPRDIYFRPADRFVATFIGSTNLLPATALERVAADGVAAVRLADGSVVQCTFTTACAAGQAVAISVRPESLVLLDPTAPADATRNRFEGTVVSAAFTGPSVRYEVETGGSRLIALDRPDATRELGQRIALGFSAAQAVALVDRTAGQAAPGTTSGEGTAAQTTGPA